MAQQLEFSEIKPENDNLRNLLEDRLPRSAMIYNVLQLCKSNKDGLTKTMEFNFLAYKGDLELHTAFVMASINVKGLPQNLIVVSHGESPTEEMLDAFTNSLNWSQPNQFEAIGKIVADKIARCGRQHGKVLEHDPIELYYLPKETAQLSYAQAQSDSTFVKELSIKDTWKINDRWPAAGEGTLEMLKASIEFVGSAGVYIENPANPDDDPELVSWAVALPFGSIHALHTEPNHQRKGYARLTMQAVSQCVSKNSRIPLVQIYKSNDTSKALNEKVGYTYSHDINLIHYYPKERTE